MHLLGNAIKYSPPQGTVTLQLARSAAEWTLSVTDQGPGIAAEQQPQRFQHFRRALHAGAHDPGGIGLGLAFVRVVARKHGGNASVVSNAGHGATFALALQAPAQIPAGSRRSGRRAIALLPAAVRPQGRTLACPPDG